MTFMRIEVSLEGGIFRHIAGEVLGVAACIATRPRDRDAGAGLLRQGCREGLWGQRAQQLTSSLLRRDRGYHMRIPCGGGVLSRGARARAAVVLTG